MIHPTKVFPLLARILGGLLAIWVLAAPGLANARTFPTPGIAAMAVAELPPEARTTISLIRKGGPFPYRRDGIEFQNRENRLPPRARGYYHEYTVRTPGESDRGARRIIAGSAEEFYFTSDHYRSFRRITP